MIRLYRNNDGGEGGGAGDGSANDKNNNGGGDGGEGSAAGENGGEGGGEGGAGNEGGVGAGEPQPITDEILFAELGKRYPTIKGKEDLDRFSSFKPEEYIKVDPQSKHADFVKKAAAWAGDIETLVEVSKLNVTEMDNKEAIVKNMMITKNMDRKIAEAYFQKNYAAAFLKEDDDGYDETEHILAKHQFEQDSVQSKAELSKWRSQREEEGVSKPKSELEAERMAAAERDWVQPVKQAIKEVNSINFNLSYDLPDKTKVEEPFTLSLENSESKKIAEDLLASKTTDEFFEKFVKRYGLGEDGKTADLKKLLEPILFFENRHELIKNIATVSASRGVANHLKTVRPGSLSGNDKGDKGTDTKVSASQSIVDAANKSYHERLNN